MQVRSFLYFSVLCFSLSCREAELKSCPHETPEKMSCVPGGRFIVGSNSSKWRDENPAHEVVLSTFLIDQFEVTTREYQNCVKRRACTPAVSNYRQMRGLNQPQLKVSWYQAREYCQKHGKRLPTEAEFEAASRGPGGEMYPWGNEKADCERAVIFSGPGRGCTSAFQDQGNTAAVGSRKAGRYGLYDMAGNAHEWVSDWYERDYKKCAENCFGRDPQGPCQGEDNCPGYEKRSVKGGSWYWSHEWARASKRRAYHPSNQPPHHFGFRCAKTVGEP